jgi:S1-C subfamily serine protease
MRWILGLVLLAVPLDASAADPVVKKLQDISVTVKAGMSQGSGVLFTRKRGDSNLTFVWTAGHVVDGLRKTREVIDSKTGTRRTVVEFDDARIVQEFRQNGRRIGETALDAKVVRYSDAEQGEDLALLLVRKVNFDVPDNSVEFYLEKDAPEIGTEVYHVGSLLGQFGANSLTTGVVSQIGRVLDLGANGIVFDQTTATAFPGSSGGGMYLKSDGRYIGMLVRGAGEGFNFIVPIRRLRTWAKAANIEWAIDQSIDVPSDADLAKLPIEDTGVTFDRERLSNSRKYPTLIYKEELSGDTAD